MSDDEIRTTALVRIPVRVPASDSLHMPAEWEPHAGCWMAWPCRPELWEDRLDAAGHAYARVARVIADFEPVTMLVHPRDAANAQRLCGPAVDVWPLSIDDSWTRDSGPTFVTDGHGQVAGVDWIFNGWGHVYEGFDNDAVMAQAILARLAMRRYVAPFILEGGSIHVDGRGTLLATEECLHDPERNAGFGRQDFEELFGAYLGIKKVIWLGQGLDNDETSGHVDNVACFVRPGVVMIQAADDPQDPNHKVYVDNKNRLEAARDASGSRLEIISVQQPAHREFQGERLTLSYINFYLANGAVIMPAFDDPMDGAALALMQRSFADRRVVQIPALEILKGGGGIHCIAQQQPAGRPMLPF